MSASQPPYSLSCWNTGLQKASKLASWLLSLFLQGYIKACFTAKKDNSDGNHSLGFFWLTSLLCAPDLNNILIGQTAQSAWLVQKTSFALFMLLNTPESNKTGGADSSCATTIHHSFVQTFFHRPIWKVQAYFIACKGCVLCPASQGYQWHTVCTSLTH